MNSALWAAYPRLTPESVAPEGAIAVEVHQDLSGNPQQLYAMEKRSPGFDPGGGDWEYLVLAPDGSVETRGILAFCARCHAEAPHDHLFGPRLSAKRHILQTAPSAEPPSETDEDSATAPDEEAPPGAGGKTPPPKKRRKK